jgi:hypothetical protein
MHPNRPDSLDQLISDHEFLADPAAGRRILFCVDVADLLLFAFPYAKYRQRELQELFTDEVQADILSGQVERSSFVFGLPEDRHYYPIFLPPVYTSELISFIHSPTLVNANVNIERQMQDFAQRIDTWAEFSPPVDSNALDSMFSSRQRRDLLSAFLQICPQLLFVASGAFPRGLNAIERMFKEERVTVDILKWLPKEMHDRCLDLHGNLLGFEFDNAGEDAQIKQFFHDELRVLRVEEHIDKKFKKSWMSDVKTIRFVSQLNRLLNPDTLVLFVSSAPMIQRVFRNKEFAALYSCHWCDTSGAERHTTFLRHPLVFAEYLKYQQQLSAGTKTSPDPTLVVKKVREAIGQAVSATEGRSDDTLDRLSLSKLARAINALAKSGRAGLEQEEWIDSEAYSMLGLSRHATTVAHALLHFEKLASLYANASIRLRVHLASELVAWIALAHLQNRGVLKRTLEAALADFTLFPFRVTFKNREISLLVCRMSEVFRIPGAEVSESELRQFHESLSALAVTCSLFNLDDQPSSVIRAESVTNYEVSEVAERKLVWLVILLALRQYQIVYQDTVRILESVESSPFRNEFRVVAIQARILELLSSRASGQLMDTAALQWVVRTCDEWIRTEDSADPRFHCLSGFAVALVARKVVAGLGEWPGNYDREWAISTLRQGMTMISRDRIDALSSIVHLPWEQRHLLGSMAATLGFLLSLSGAQRDVEEAMRVVDRYGLPMENQTSMCLHNLAFILMQRMRLVVELDELDGLYQRSFKALEMSDARRIDPVGVVEVLTADISSVKNLSVVRRKRLYRDAIELRLLHEKKRIDLGAPL